MRVEFVTPAMPDKRKGPAVATDGAGGTSIQQVGVYMGSTLCNTLAHCRHDGNIHLDLRFPIVSNNYGFIYILAHEYMPGIYKIGRTDRAPHQRAAELSSSTSVPCPFDVLFFLEVSEPVEAEADIHAHFDSKRLSQTREFFRLSREDLFQVAARIQEEWSCPDQAEGDFRREFYEWYQAKMAATLSAYGSREVA